MLSRIRRTLLWLLLPPALLALSTCSELVSSRDQIRALGKIRVVTLNSPTSYFVDGNGESGFEYDLVRHFAETLGVQLDLQVADNLQQAMDWVQRGRAHLGAAGLAITPQRRQAVKFSPPIRRVVPQFVYRMGRSRPSDLGDLDGELRVSLETSHPELLFLLAADYPQLEWIEDSDNSPGELLRQVAEGELDYTVANSDLVAINKRYYPQLNVAFDLTEGADLGWIFARDDESLYHDARNFLLAIADHELLRLKDRYFGHIERVGYVGAITLASHVESRLPKYRERFEQAAAEYGLDWRLLAAVGYQESHWNPNAVSPTGVRGLMQITRNTADYLGISNRLDPEQAITGAGRYIRSLSDRLPPEVQEPDRTWMTLASYNIGINHVRDARILAQQQGGDPNRWVDVRRMLPLLTQSKWHKQTKYGYARGHEAVTYVGNIRTYYDMLTWMTGGSTDQPMAPSDPVTEPLEEKPERADPLAIDAPIL